MDAPTSEAAQTEPKRRRIPVTRVIVYAVLMLVGVGGLWYWNDSKAVEATNECIEKWNQSLKSFQGLPYASNAADLAKEIRPKIDHILAHRGGRGPLGFLTRGEVSVRSGELHQNAGAMLVVLHLLNGDVKGARAAMDGYKAIAASYGAPSTSAAELAGMSEKLLAAEGIDAMSPELLRSSVCAGLSAAPRPVAERPKEEQKPEEKPLPPAKKRVEVRSEFVCASMFTAAEVQALGFEEARMENCCTTTSEERGDTELVLPVHAWRLASREERGHFPSTAVRIRLRIWDTEAHVREVVNEWQKRCEGFRGDRKTEWVQAHALGQDRLFIFSTNSLVNTEQHAYRFARGVFDVEFRVELGGAGHPRIDVETGRRLAAAVYEKLQ